MVIFLIAIVLLLGGTVYKGYLVTKEIKASISNQFTLLDTFRDEISDSKQLLEVFQNNTTSEVAQKLHQVEEATTALLENFYNLHKEVLDVVKTYTKNYEELAETGEHNKATLAELHRNIERYRKDFKQTKDYVLNATQKLEQRPEHIRIDLEKIIKEHRAQIKALTTEADNIRAKVSQESDYFFSEISKIKDTQGPKRNPRLTY